MVLQSKLTKHQIGALTFKAPVLPHPFLMRLFGRDALYFPLPFQIKESPERKSEGVLDPQRITRFVLLFEIPFVAKSLCICCVCIFFSN